MEMSKLYYTVQKEIPSDAVISSHQLMIKGCYIKQLASGVYTFLPLGLKALRNVETIIRKEMDQYAQELIMPALLPADLFKITGRWEKYGNELFHLEDRNHRDFCLGPTHEEFFTSIVKQDIKSYKKLPIVLYQIQNKYRDEKRPRFGILRSRDFVMKDAYSFNMDEDSLNTTYQEMKQAYINIFTKCELDFAIVDADSGAIGGDNSQEFMAKSDIGEDDIIHCTCCDFSANIEKAPCLTQIDNLAEPMQEIEELYTPNVKTIAQLEESLADLKNKFVKQLIYKADDSFVAVLLKGNREVNETKLANYLGCIHLELANLEEVEKVTGAQVGFAGPVDLNLPIYLDHEIEHMKNMVVGANKTDYHLKNVNPGRDFSYKACFDFRNIEPTDSCPKCGKEIELIKGIEVGHIFQLGTAYSDKLDCTYLDQEGQKKTMLMGCYGIGVSRLLAAIVEQHNDENGIIWPMCIAPYHVSVIPISMDDALQKQKAYEIYNQLQHLGLSCLIDDRKERPGVKFKDADLIGCPFRIVVGRDISEGKIEFKKRSESTSNIISLEDFYSIIKEEIKSIL